MCIRQIDKSILVLHNQMLEAPPSFRSSSQNHAWRLLVSDLSRPSLVLRCSVFGGFMSIASCRDASQRKRNPIWIKCWFLHLGNSNVEMVLFHVCQGLQAWLVYQQWHLPLQLQQLSNLSNYFISSSSEMVDSWGKLSQSVPFPYQNQWPQGRMSTLFREKKSKKTRNGMPSCTKVSVLRRPSEDAPVLKTGCKTNYDDRMVRLLQDTTDQQKTGWWFVLPVEKQFVKRLYNHPQIG